MERVLKNVFETIDGNYQIGKGNEFYTAFSSYILDKEKNEDFWLFFNTKRYRISGNFISYRLINHWESEGLINADRIEENGWRKYSLMDIVWLLIIKELRHFGLSLPNIKSVRQSLVSRYEQCEYGELEFYTALAYISRTPAFVLAFSHFRAEVATAYEIIDSTDKYGLKNHVSININSILQSLFPTMDLRPIYQNFLEIDPVQQQIIETQQMENVEKIKLYIREGKPIKMVVTVSEELDSNIGQLKVKDSFQKIEVILHDSKTQKVQRKVSKHFSK